MKRGSKNVERKRVLEEKYETSRTKRNPEPSVGKG
jgi:hypothetical protein